MSNIKMGLTIKETAEYTGIGRNTMKNRHYGFTHSGGIHNN